MNQGDQGGSSISEWLACWILAGSGSKPLFKRALTFAGWVTEKDVLNADALVQVRPVNSLSTANEPPAGARLRPAIQQPWKPSERGLNSTSVGQLNFKRRTRHWRNNWKRSGPPNSPQSADSMKRKPKRPSKLPLPSRPKGSTAKTAALCQSNRVQPELCSVPLAFHVNVRRFIPIRPRRRKTDMARFAMQSALVPDNIPSPSICPPFRILQKPCLSMKTSIAAIKDAVYFGVPGFAFGTRDSATADRQKWIVCQVE